MTWIFTILEDIESKLSEKELANESLRTELLEYENELVHKIENILLQLLYLVQIQNKWLLSWVRTISFIA